MNYREQKGRPIDAYLFLQDIDTCSVTVYKDSMISIAAKQTCDIRFHNMEVWAILWV